MIEEFQYYIEKDLVKKQTPNKEEAKALIDKAFDRFEYIKEQRIDKSTSSFIFEDIYESLREAAQSLMALKGYKPYSHEALIAFLKEFYGFSDYIVSRFDNFRRLRNKCVYGAAVISVSTCKDALGFLVSLLPKFKKKFDKGVKR